MKLFTRLLIISSLIIGCAVPAHAQYYQMANQLTQMISPALSGSFRYRGFADASYLTGIGTNGCSFLEFSTTQGFKYGSWFFMGVGAGVDVMFSDAKGNQPTNDWRPGNQGGNFNPDYSRRETGVIIPLYSDFRFNIGNEKNVSAFIDLRVGASFLVGRNYIQTPDGILNNSEGLYFKPSAGIRIPMNDADSRQALNIGVSYQLISTNYWSWSGIYNGTTVNALGVSVGYEW